MTRPVRPTAGRGDDGDGLRRAAPASRRLLEVIRERAPGYLAIPPASDVTVTTFGCVRRTHSLICGVRIAGGGSSVDLLAKQLVGDPGAATGPNRHGRDGEPRPRLAAVATFGERFRLEYEGLRLVDDAFRSQPDGRLGSVRVFDYLPERHALVMERLDRPSLRALYARTVRRPRPGPSARRDLGPVFASAGAWLRRYHALPPLPGSPARHADRAALVATIDELCRFLGRNLDEPARFSRLARVLERCAADALPPRLRLGPVHGDFAMRNLLVGPGDRVTGLDMAPGWQVPVLEDVAYFLGDLRTSLPRTLSQGWTDPEREIGRLQEAFLEGYGGDDPVPLGAVHLYEVLVILDRWWGTPPRAPGTIGGRVRAAIAGPLVDRFFDREIRRLLALPPGPTRRVPQRPGVS